MATKESPGEFDCYASALLDEPIFVLLARDDKAPFAVRKWARRYRLRRGDDAKYQEAMKCARNMEIWREKNTKRISAAKGEAPK